MDSIIITRDYRQAIMAFANYLGLPMSSLDQANITPYDVELHQPLIATQNSYTANLRTGSGKPWESYLVNGDLFFCYGMAIQITKYDHASATKLTRPYFSYPDPNFFAVAGESNALELIWNGTLDFNVQSISKIQGWKAQHYRYAPPANYAGTYAVPTALNQYGPSFEERGFLLNSLYPVINGNDTNIIKLTLGTGDATGINGAAGVAQNQLIFKLTGFKYTGGLGTPGQCSI